MCRTGGARGSARSQWSLTFRGDGRDLWQPRKECHSANFADPLPTLSVRPSVRPSVHPSLASPTWLSTVTSRTDLLSQMKHNSCRSILPSVQKRSCLRERLCSRSTLQHHWRSFWLVDRFKVQMGSDRPGANSPDYQTCSSQWDCSHRRRMFAGEKVNPRRLANQNNVGMRMTSH